MKRFYKTTSVHKAQNTGAFEVHLDARVLKTSAKRPLVLPTPALAQAIADEWSAQAQDEDIDPASMPMTGYAFTALDIVDAKIEAVRKEVARYAETDLLCYVTAEPAALSARLTAAWQPMLDWSAKALDAPLVVTAGLMAVAQPPESMASIERQVEALDLWALTSMQTLTSVLGSVVLAFAVFQGRLTAQQAFELARMEESYQAEQWGQDEDDAEKQAQDLAEFGNAAHFLQIARVNG